MPNTQYDSRYLEYFELFNQREFYACHEVLEDLWLDDHGPMRKYYQGLIHYATAFFHLFRRNMPGCEKLLASAKRLLAPYPEVCEGLHLGRVRENIEYWQRKLANRGDGIVPYDDAMVPILKLEQD